VDGARALLGLEGAVEHGEVLVLQVRRALDRLLGVHVVDDVVDVGLLVAEPAERLGHGPVHDLQHPAAHELLVLHEGDVRLHSGGVAVHHERDRAGGRQDGGLGVPETVLPADLDRLVPHVS
jgi:hypothetical protein